MDIGFAGWALDPGASEESATRSLAKLQSAFEKLVRDTCRLSDAPINESELEHASTLVWQGVRAGSLVHEHEVHPGLGAQAGDRLLSWSGAHDDESLPAAVRRTLLSIADEWPDDLTAFWISNRQETRCVKVQLPGVVDVRVDGWLKEVNWHDRTARLHLTDGDWVTLRFGRISDIVFKQHANTYVKVKGQGKTDANGNWKFVDVTELECASADSNPADYMTELRERLAKRPRRDIRDRRRASWDFDPDAFMALVDGED